ncbi:MAG: hypothetical protein WB609_01390 [Candidatus Cybelea sp.]
MKFVDFGRIVLCGCVAGVMLAGCGALPLSLSKGQDDTQPPIRAAGIRSQSVLSLALAPWLRPIARIDLASANRRSTPSWMARGAMAQNLLYISNGGADNVYVYSYPAGSLVGKLGQLQDPVGLCVDRTGNVWIVNSASSTIVEYAHGSKKRKATLQDYGLQNLLGCAVDPLNGNLAVTELGSPSSAGNVWIYPNAKGSPKKFRDPQMQYVYFCGYDDRGNLFVDGLNSNYGFVFAERLAGSRSLRSISLNQSVGFPGGIQWDGTYVAIGDQFYQTQHKSAIYQVSVSGSTGTVQGTTLLSGACDVLQFDISSLGSTGSSVVAPDDCRNNAAFYNYPAGGSPTKTLSGFQYPFGAAVSLAQ